MEENKFKFMWWSICFIVFWIGLITLGGIANMPNSFFTNHYIDVNMDNETMKAMEYLSNIKDYEMRENNLYCDNQLLNQSMLYEKYLADQKQYYQVYCWKGNVFNFDCLD